MRIYTKTGDKGTTGLIGGSRVSKESLRIKAIGAIDELNAAIGLCRLYSKDFPHDQLLKQIQDWLFESGAEITTPADSKYYKETIQIEQIELLEKSIDQQNEALPPLRNFILPGGGALAAHLHMARTVCRRAERQVLHLNKKEPVREALLMFYNRLSDWFFITARTANQLENIEDVQWVSS